MGAAYQLHRLRLGVRQAVERLRDCPNLRPELRAQRAVVMHPAVEQLQLRGGGAGAAARRGEARRGEARQVRKDVGQIPHRVATATIATIATATAAATAAATIATAAATIATAAATIATGGARRLPSPQPAGGEPRGPPAHERLPHDRRLVRAVRRDGRRHHQLGRRVEGGRREPGEVAAAKRREPQRRAALRQRRVADERAAQRLDAARRAGGARQRDAHRRAQQGEQVRPCLGARVAAPRRRRHRHQPCLETPQLLGPQQRPARVEQAHRWRVAVHQLRQQLQLPAVWEGGGGGVGRERGVASA